CRLRPSALPDRPVFRSYRTAIGRSSVPVTQRGWEEALRDGLRAAVERQLMADVPVGSLLSGGADSTVVTRLMADALPSPPQAFGIGFAEEPDGGELANARRAAIAVGVPLTEVSVSEAEYRGAWPRPPASLGEA